MVASFALIWTITLAATLLQAGNGLLQALLPLRMQAEGLSIPAIGLVATSYGFGFASGCFLAPAFVRHVGHIRAFASLAAISAVVMLGFTQAHSVLAWTVLRILTGIALAGLFTVIDGWISASASASDRGRIVSIYIVCTRAAQMISPLGIALGDVREDQLFMAVTAIICLSVLPVSATVAKEPTSPQGVRIDVRGMFKIAPSAIVGAFVVGLVNGPVTAIAPVYGTGVGFSPDEAAALLFALQAGGFLFQWPLGWLSDRADRRYVIAGLSAGAALVSLFILAVSTRANPTVITIAFGLWGGLALCIYAVCVAHACDLVEPGQIVPTVSTLLFAWAAGMTIGPMPGAYAMDLMGPGGLFIYAAVVSSLLALFVIMRIAQQRRQPARGGFVDISTTSAETASLREDVKSEEDRAA